MKFTWPEKFTRTIEKVPDELLPKLIRAILAYGTDGVEPELEFPLDSIFESMREDIDNSHKFRDGGSRGGSRAKRAQGEADCEPGEADADGLCEPSVEDEQACKASDTACKPSDTPCKPSDTACKPCDTPCKGFEKASPSNPIQTNPVQSKPTQDTEDTRAAKRPRFVPPGVEEVEAYCREMGYTFSAESFVAFYASNGWKVGKNPMRSWKAACTTWQQRQGAQQRGGAGDAYSRL